MRIKVSVLLLFCALSAWAQRVEENLKTWEFSRDRAKWQTVDIPHDWAISDPFDKKWDLQRVAIQQNGETKQTEKSGRTGSLPWIGEGHYRRQIQVSDRYRHNELVFDGAMSQPVVKVNGRVAGGWKYGYNAFRVDISSYVHPGTNLVEVDLLNSGESSRWYPGAGLYRPVTLLSTSHPSFIDDWQTFVETLSADGQLAKIRISGRVQNARPGQIMSVEVKKDGRHIGHKKTQIGSDGAYSFEMAVVSPKLWSPESPQLYQATLSLLGDVSNPKEKGSMKWIDSRQMRFGIRTVKVSRERGFELNGQSRKLKGVCLHHDLGPLGAAVNRDALVRQITILKEMGCDAIRTSHNMPSTMQMEVCDEMGMMVMAESFDAWKTPKCRNDYSRFFREWADRDITNLVLRHRNHPSIVMWSIGNEIPDQGSVEGRNIARHLQDLVHKLDPTRPVTQGMERPDEALNVGFAQVMDVPGFNYRVFRYDSNIKRLPAGFLLASETASTISSRGVYKFPVLISDHAVYPDRQCSSYDTEYCPWSNLPEDDFMMMDDRAWTIGQFVWTGFDYLGEPTPYDEHWPSRSSYFGICDLAGLPKDRFYLYRSQWNKKRHTLHVLPHWTWRGREGEVTPVYVYTDYPEAELFINGKSQGRRKKDVTIRQIISNHDGKNCNEELLDRYRLRWNNVVYQPGELKVVAYDENGIIKAETKKITAGEPAQLILNTAAVAEENSDGLVEKGKPAVIRSGELAFVTVQMADAKGVLVPDCNDLLEFQVEGGTFKAVCNGDATSVESFTEPRMHLFNGKLVVTLQSGKSQKMTLTVRDAKRRIESSIDIYAL